MDFEGAFEFVDEAIFAKEGKHLNDIERIIIEGTWESQSYGNIANKSGYDEQHIKNEACKLWRLLGKAFEEKVCKSNFRTVVERRSHDDCII